MAFFTGLAALVTLGATAYSFDQSRKAQKQSQAADRERRAAAQVQQKIEEQRYFKDRIFRIAEARKERGAIVAKQQATGMRGSSRGQVAQIQSQAASNLGYQQNIFSLGQQVSGLQYQASIFDTSASAYLNRASMLQGIAKFSRTTPQLAQDISTIFS
tara:strand:- start:576 stop:1049 length:474 start_codon:yes stop_codon:yes gene_type:complete